MNRLPPEHRLPGMEPTTLKGNQTGNSWVRGMTPNQPSHTGQDPISLLGGRVVSIKQDKTQYRKKSRSTTWISCLQQE